MISLNLTPLLQSLTPITLQYSTCLLPTPSSLLYLPIVSAISKANLKSFRLYFRKLRVPFKKNVKTVVERFVKIV